MPSKLGRALKAARAAKELTQEQVGRLARITPEYLSMLESGRETNPSLDVLRRLGKALGVRVGRLVD